MGLCCWLNELNMVIQFSKCFLVVLVITIASIAFLCLIAYIFIRRKLKIQRDLQKRSSSKLAIGFFHPYCNAGGGGERVLWCALKALSERFVDYRFIIYTGDTEVTRDQFLKKVNSNFNITFPNDVPIDFIYLERRVWVEASKYPYFTLLGQSVGSMFLGFEAISKFVPDVYFDTIGYAFTLPIFKLFGRCKVACYIHYPTISTDMLNRISSRTESYNNASTIAKNPILSNGKLIYYKLFACLYSNVGYWSSDIVMVNSSWTFGHINSLWKCPNKTFKIFPPCNIKEFQEIKKINHSKIKVLSIAQFRPEKNYPLQLESFAMLKEILTSELWSKVQLVCIGSCRNEEDKQRVEDLKELAKKLDIETNVMFKINVPFDELRQEMSEGLIGIHTMWNEHFGIGIVESMAAGLIMVANNSGGPMMDIVNSKDDTNRTGFLASSKEEYAECIKTIIEMSNDEMESIRNRARISVERFSDLQFKNELIHALQPILL